MAEEAILYKCDNCGGDLTFVPGQPDMTCVYCGSKKAAPASEQGFDYQEELDFGSALAKFERAETGETVRIAKCTACGAEVTFEGNVTSGACDFCGTNIVAQGEGNKVMPPQYLIPFQIKQDEALKRFRVWLKKRWFKPSKLTRYARGTGGLKGFFFPFWTYDTQTETSYSGRRGDDYTVTVGSGDNKRTETRTRWTNVTGRVKRFFDDFLVAAGRALPAKLTERLDEWDLSRLVPYDEAYLAGMKAEAYSIDVKDGFDIGKGRMTRTIQADIRRDIGGDRQQIIGMNTRWDDITFKYVLLPIWSLTYKFKDKYYKVLVNAQTGEVEGERPWSWIKITLFALFIAAVGGGLYYLSQVYGN